MLRVSSPLGAKHVHDNVVALQLLWLLIKLSCPNLIRRTAMAVLTLQTDSPRNAWRQMTPGHSNWTRTARAGDPNKYFMVSVDTHGIEPTDFLAKRIEKQYLDRIPRVTVDEDGAEWMVTEGIQPMLVKPGRDAVKHLIAREAYEEPDYFQPYTSRMEAEDRLRYRAGVDVTQRVRDAEADGVDAE